MEITAILKARKYSIRITLSCVIIEREVITLCFLLLISYLFVCLVLTPRSGSLSLIESYLFANLNVSFDYLIDIIELNRLIAKHKLLLLISYLTAAN